MLRCIFIRNLFSTYICNIQLLDVRHERVSLEVLFHVVASWQASQVVCR